MSLYNFREGGPQVTSHSIRTRTCRAITRTVIFILMGRDGVNVDLHVRIFCMEGARTCTCTTRTMEQISGAFLDTCR